MPIFFMSLRHVRKHHLIEGNHGYAWWMCAVSGGPDTGHLPKAKSIPLAALSRRMAEIPRDIPVVLY